MKKIAVFLVFLLAVAGGIWGVLAQREQPAQPTQTAVTNNVGTVFVYQGRLNEGNQPANGLYDMEFRLFDALEDGNQIGNVVAQENITVTNGLFNVDLDFGETVFSGETRYLEISVRNSAGDYETLMPRVVIRPVPYAQHAGSAYILAAEMLPPAVITATAMAGGVLTSGTYYFKVVASDGVGTTVGSAEASCVINGSSTNRCALTWQAVTGAANYRIYKGAAAGEQDRYQTTTTTNYNYDTDNGATLGTIPATTTAFVNNLRPFGNSWLLGGNVGIGTVSPNGLLEIAGDLSSSATAGIVIHNTSSINNNGHHIQIIDDSAGFARFSLTGYGALLGFDKGGSPAYSIRTGGGDSFFNAAGGNVGIGTATPAVQLHLVGDGRLRLEASGGVIWDINNTGANGFAISDITNNTARLIIETNGNVGIGTSNATTKFQVGNSGDGTTALANDWNTFSDARYKTDIVPLENTAELVAQLEGVRFTWKESGQESIGFIAQDVQTVLPELVHADEAGYLSVDYGKITPVLVEAVKEQQTEIEELQRQNEQLTAELAAIRTQLATLETAPQPSFFSIPNLGLALLIAGGVAGWQKRGK